MELYGALWSAMELMESYEASWTHMKPDGALWSSMERYEASWSHMKLDGAIWGLMDL